MNCSTPGFPVNHQLPELAQTHVHRVGDLFNSICSIVLCYYRLPGVFSKCCGDPTYLFHVKEGRERRKEKKERQFCNVKMWIHSGVNAYGIGKI